MWIFFKVYICIIYKDNILLRMLKYLYIYVFRKILFFFILVVDLKFKMNRKFIFGLGVLI